MDGSGDSGWPPMAFMNIAERIKMGRRRNSTKPDELPPNSATQTPATSQEAATDTIMIGPDAGPAIEPNNKRKRTATETKPSPPKRARATPAKSKKANALKQTSSSRIPTNLSGTFIAYDASAPKRSSRRPKKQNDDGPALPSATSLDTQTVQRPSTPPKDTHMAQRPSTPPTDAQADQRSSTPPKDTQTVQIPSKPLDVTDISAVVAAMSSSSSTPPATLPISPGRTAIPNPTPSPDGLDIQLHRKDPAQSVPESTSAADIPTESPSELSQQPCDRQKLPTPARCETLAPPAPDTKEQPKEQVEPTTSETTCETLMPPVSPTKEQSREQSSEQIDSVLSEPPSESTASVQDQAQSAQVQSEQPHAPENDGKDVQAESADVPMTESVKTSDRNPLQSKELCANPSSVSEPSKVQPRELREEDSKDEECPSSIATVLDETVTHLHGTSRPYPVPPRFSPTSTWIAPKPVTSSSSKSWTPESGFDFKQRSISDGPQYAAPQMFDRTAGDRSTNVCGPLKNLVVQNASPTAISAKNAGNNLGSSSASLTQTTQMTVPNLQVTQSHRTMPNALAADIYNGTAPAFAVPRYASIAPNKPSPSFLDYNSVPRAREEPRLLMPKKQGSTNAPTSMRLVPYIPVPNSFISPTPVHEEVDPLTLRTDEFIVRLKRYLHQRGSQKSGNSGVAQARKISALMDMATPPAPHEALYLSLSDAAAHLAPNVYTSCPIITAGGQTMALQTPNEFLGEFYNEDAKVHVQDPTVKLSTKKAAVRPVTIRELKARFKEKTPGDQAWNCLELATHVEDGLRPAFLNGEDCRLLTKLKHPSSTDKVSRQSYEPGWKEVEKWALLAQAGALTEPHQDSHGYSTYITVNHGLFGFGWLSNPTPEERRAWNSSPTVFTGGRWRYVVLRPGQTVFFPGGTVHFVFRLPEAGNTLAFGGHVLRCSQIVRWAQTLIDEKKNSSITNENLTVSAPEYLNRVANFVAQALLNGQTARWGGKESCEEFMRLKREYGKTRKGK